MNLIKKKIIIKPAIDKYYKSVSINISISIINIIILKI